MLKSVSELNLNPEIGKKCWTNNRPMDQEFIYFIMVDRFADGKSRTVEKTEGRSEGFGSPDELGRFYGGTLKGITSKLEYLEGLGVTAIGLSPVFENNPTGYHGYATQNYLTIDPHFGTPEDLRDLVSKAHAKEIKVFLDVVINHTGDNWSYARNLKPWYKKGTKYSFGNWNNDLYPLPVELRNQNFYRREGMIKNWDNYPETESGDFFILKKMNLDASPEGMELMAILIKIYSYWIKETDCDGFRIDALKHLGKEPAAAFCNGIRSYCEQIGKADFIIFGELIAGDTVAKQFLKSVAGEGVDMIFDFPLHFLISDVIKGIESPRQLMERYLSFGKELKPQSGNSPFINFLDNHDQVGMQIKKRIGTDLSLKQLTAAIGLLFCLPGTPTIYYGTEQWLSGSGQGDQSIREALFDKNGDSCLHNPEHIVYKLMKLFSDIRRQIAALCEGTIQFEEFEETDSKENNITEVLVFSRISKEERIVIAYNTSPSKTKYIKFKNRISSTPPVCIYGDPNAVKRNVIDGMITIELQSSDFVMLK